MEPTSVALVQGIAAVVLFASAMSLFGVGLIAAAVLHVMKGGR